MDKQKNPRAQTEVGLRIRLLRESMGLSGSHVARSCGLDQSNYSKIEHGAIRLQPEHAAELCTLFGVDLEYIYLGDTTNGPKSH